MADEKTMVRVGKISSVNPSKKQARVFYPSMNDMVSDWLPVIQSGTNWMPSVNDKVLVLMEYGFNANGYILGVIP